MTRVGLLSLCCLFAVGCSKSADPSKPEGDGTQTPSGTTDPTPTNPVVVDGGFKCRIDDDCEVLDLALRCDDVTNECVPGKLCNDSTNCGDSNLNHYCSIDGVG